MAVVRDAKCSVVDDTAENVLSNRAQARVSDGSTGDSKAMSSASARSEVGARWAFPCAYLPNASHASQNCCKGKGIRQELARLQVPWMSHSPKPKCCLTQSPALSKERAID